MAKIAIVDVDGTLTRAGDRVKHLSETPPNWDKFYDRCGEDEPKPDVIGVVNALSADGYRIVCLTGRRESCRKDTERWLARNGCEWGTKPDRERHPDATYYDDWAKADKPIPEFEILMRGDDDHRHDTVLKLEMLEKAVIPLRDICVVFEDRDSVVEMWRENGLTVMQVAPGDF